MKKIITAVIILILLLRFRATPADELPETYSSLGVDMSYLFTGEVNCETMKQSLDYFKAEEASLVREQDALARRDRNFMISAVTLTVFFIPFGFLALGVKGNGETVVALRETREAIFAIEKGINSECTF